VNTTLVLLGWQFVLMGAYCVHRVLRADRQLRQILPPAIERRHHNEHWQHLADEHELGPRARIALYVVPMRWNRQLYSADHHPVVDRLWNALFGVVGCTVVAIFLFAAGVGYFGT
jgi:hypothetical protein